MKDQNKYPKHPSEEDQGMTDPKAVDFPTNPEPQTAEPTMTDMILQVKELMSQSVSPPWSLQWRKGNSVYHLVIASFTEMAAPPEEMVPEGEPSTEGSN
jgi:hypothetical protein